VAVVIAGLGEVAEVNPAPATQSSATVTVISRHFILI